MNRVSKALVVVVVAALGVWGCAQGPSAQNAGGSDRIKGLEREVAKLQDDYRSLMAARDQVRKNFAQAEEARARLQGELEQVLMNTARERDELKGQALSRAAEREAALREFDGFRRNLRNMLIQADAAAAAVGGTPVITSIEPIDPVEPNRS